MEELQKIQQDEQVLKTLNNVQKLELEVEELNIKDITTENRAIEILAELKNYKNKIEDRRKFYTVPLNDMLKKLNASAKTFKEPVEKVYNQLDKKLRAYKMELERIRQEELKRLEEERLKKIEVEKEKSIENQKPIPEITIDEKKNIKSDSGTYSYKKVWKFKIIDAKKVPDIYKIVDEKEIRKSVNMGIRKIAGVKIYEEVESSFRTK